MRILRLAFAFALLLLPSLATAQQFPTIPSDTVIGRTQIGSGPAQAIPFSQLIALMLQQSALNIPTVNTNSIIFKGSTSGQATLQAQAVAGTPTLNLPNTSGTIPSNATSPIVIDPASGNISCPTCATSTSAANPVVASRALAETLNLSGLSSLTTLGYATPGDGGGATFKNIGSANFTDSFVPTGTGGLTITTTGSGCTNGSYNGIIPTGGNGSGLTAQFTVSGGILTAFNVTGTGGNAYQVGDVLTVPATVPCTTQPTLTVASISTPTGSFTDSVGTRFQIVADQGNFVNVRQFGAKVDRGLVTTDGAATNDFQAIQNALSFASVPIGLTVDAGGSAGQTVIIPHGTSLFCGGSTPLLIPFGVTLKGQGRYSSTLKLCDTGENAATAPIDVCDPTTHLACFGAKIEDISIYANTSAGNANVPVIFSNNFQQSTILARVQILAGTRSCVQYDTGYGGAALVGFEEIECGGVAGSISTGMNFTNVGTTEIRIANSVVEVGGSGTSGPGINISGGFFRIAGGHTEGYTTGIAVNIPSSSANGFVEIEGWSGGSNCTNLVVRQGGSAANTVLMTNLAPNGCTNTYNNGGTGSGVVVVGPNTLI